MDSLAIDIAKYLIVVPVLSALYLLWTLGKKHRREYLILLVVGGVLSLLVAKIARHFYYDPRPFIKDDVTPLFNASRDNGFPSDHTLLAAFIGFASLPYSRLFGYGLLAVAGLIGWARVFSGVHHFVDVLGSFIITAVSAGIVYWFITKYRPGQSKSKKADEVVE